MDIRKEHFNGVYSTIFEHMGERVTREIHSVFRGQQFNFPKKLYSMEYVIRYLKENKKQSVVQFYEYIVAYFKDYKKNL